MTTKPKGGVDKERLNFRISSTLHDKLADFCRDTGMKTVSEAAWFFNTAVIFSGDGYKPNSPPPPPEVIA
jgi:hypothetical protein